MGKSLKDLFEISEVLDIKQEMIAKILMHTSDQDENPADEPFKELAAKLEREELSVKEAQDALDAMIDGELDEEKAIVTTIKGDETIADINPNDKTLKADPSIKSIVTTKGRKIKESVDDEGRMAKSELLKLTQYSAKLYKALGDNDQLPAWIQSKITLAADYIGTVKHYLEGEQAMGGEEAPQGQLEEAAEGTEYYNWEDLHLDIFINKPVEDIPDPVYLPLVSDGKLRLNTGNYKRALALPDGYVNDKLGKTKEDIVAQELGYLERDWLKWKNPFGDMMEGDEECVVTIQDGTATVQIDAIKKQADKYVAGKAKGDTRDVYENSLIKILSK